MEFSNVTVSKHSNFFLIFFLYTWKILILHPHPLDFLYDYNRLKIAQKGLKEPTFELFYWNSLSMSSKSTPIILKCSSLSSPILQKLSYYSKYFPLLH